MRSKISLWAGLFGIAAIVPLVQTIAMAKSSIEISRTATAIQLNPNLVASYFDRLTQKMAIAE